MKRFAAHRVVYAGTVHKPGVVEINNGRVTAHYKLTEEIAMTMWLKGTIEILEDDNTLKAYYENALLG